LPRTQLVPFAPAEKRACLMEFGIHLQSWLRYAQEASQTKS
jgi:hypothetical protein